MSNFAVDVVEAAAPDRRALVEVDRAGSRREWSFGALARATRTMAAHLDERGARRTGSVLTLVGNRAEWVVAMLACFRQGYVAVPCSEQLRAKDLR
ncbi:MAG: AMP-binding protein, partial [Actinomycetota bacterium]|nr:AMP-binding protein [Actinomycetota bacterium]